MCAKDCSIDFNNLKKRLKSLPQWRGVGCCRILFHINQSITFFVWKVPLIRETHGFSWIDF